MRRAWWSVLIFALGLSGCERGCLSTWWEHATKPKATALGPTDEEPSKCESGLLRCSAQKIQASRHAPEVKCTPEGCACPWDDVAKCDHACVVEGVAFELPVDAGAAQLCAPANDGEVFVENAVVLDAGEIACEMAGYGCADGVVSSCETAKTARCLHGCASLDEARLDADDLRAAALVLCARK